MTKIRLLGDVHGKVHDYISFCKKAEQEGYDTIQLGDLGFRETYNAIEKTLDVTKHRCILGNHDYYPHRPLNDMGDFGYFDYNGQSVFFVRGAFSIDKKYRVAGKSWFYEEELNLEERKSAVALYKTRKADIILSHESCQVLAQKIGNPQVLLNFGFDPETFSTKTNQMLQEMFDYHEPQQWFHGHYHKTYQQQIGNCNFRCLAELESCLL